MLAALAGPALAQTTAQGFFHEAAQQYVDGRLDAARATVRQGLDVAPDNARLRALLETLQKESKSSGGGRSSQTGESGQNAREQAQESNRNRGRPDGDRRGSGDESTSSENESDDAQSESSQDVRDRAQDPSASEGAGRSGRARRENVLSRAQAVRILQALESQERTLLRQLRVRDMEQQTVEKDW